MVVDNCTYNIALRRSTNVDLKSRQDDKTLTDYTITPGSVLHLVLALRGGR